jgi:cytochrome c oxidase subunit 3
MSNVKKDVQEEPFINIPLPKLYLYLLLVSLSILFIVFSIAYVSTRHMNSSNGVYLPPIFVTNTFILILSSWAMNKANKSYLQDNTSSYQFFLWFTLFLTFLFLMLQILGWTLYFNAMIGHNIGIGKQYLYAISGLHFAHVLGGIPFLIQFLYVAHYRMKEPVSVLVYFSDPAKKLRLEMLTTYWHFLDYLWIFLVVFFLLNMFI